MDDEAEPLQYFNRWPIIIYCPTGTTNDENLTTDIGQRDVNHSDSSDRPIGEVHKVSNFIAYLHDSGDM